MKFLILNNKTPIHTILSEKISQILSKNSIDNIAYSPKFSTGKVGIISIQKIFDAKSFIISLNYFFRGFRNVIVTSPSVYSLFITIIARITNNKIIYFLHEPNLTRVDFYSKFVNFYTGLMVSVSTDIIVLSKYAYDETKKKFPKRNIYLINYPAGMISKNLNFKKKYITFIGNISKNKRIDLFIKLAKKSELKFLIAGSGNLEKYHDTIKKNRIKLVNKFLSQEEYDCLMKKSLFIILPYESSTQSAVLFDSFRNGTPVISSDIGSFKEFIKYDETGYFFELNKFVENSLEVLKDINEKKIKRLQKNCIEYFNKELSDMCFEKNFIKFLKSLVK